MIYPLEKYPAFDLKQKESNQLRHSLFFVQIVITQAMCKTETKILFFEYDF